MSSYPPNNQSGSNFPYNQQPPYGQPNPYGQPQQPPYGQPQTQYGQPQQPPFGQPQQPPFGQPYPGGPGGPGGPFPPAQPPKKNPTLLIGGGVVLVIVVIVAAVFFINRPTPQKTLDTFCEGMRTLNSDMIYGTLSTGVKNQTDKEEFDQGITLIKGFGGKIECSYNNVVEAGSTATADVTLTISSELSEEEPETDTSTMKLIQENGEWKIDEDAMSGSDTGL